MPSFPVRGERRVRETRKQAATFRSCRGRRAAVWSVRGSILDGDRPATPLDRALARRRHPAEAASYALSEAPLESHRGSPAKDEQKEMGLAARTRPRES